MCMYNLIRHFNRTRYQFTAGFFSENRYVPRYRELGVRVEIMPSVPARETGMAIARKAINWYNREYKLEKYLSSYIPRNRFDLLMLNNTVYESVNFINAVSRLNLPIVVYERGIMPYTRRHVRASERIDASIAVSDAILRNMDQHKIRSKAIQRIYDGIDPGLFEGPFHRAEIRKGLGIPPDGKVIGIIGNVRYWKGQRYFLEAFELLSRRHPDVHGLIAGGWSDLDREYVESLLQRVRDAGLENRVRFLGYRSDIPALLSILDVFVHASVEPEPFGMVLLEAMAAKVPVIATKFGGPAEILDRGRCGTLVPPKDPGAIAEECSRYFTDERRRSDIVEKAYERLCGHFHIHDTVSRVEKLLESVLPGDARRR